MRRIVDGLVLAALGGILLANTTGVLPWSIWAGVISLWPVLLISAGIDLIGKSYHRQWPGALGGLLVLAALLYGALVIPAGTWGAWTAGGGATRSFASERPRVPGLTEGKAEISLGATDLTIAGGDKLASISGRAIGGFVPKLSVREEGSAAKVTVGPVPGIEFGPGPNERRLTRIDLDRDLLWRSIKLNCGASQLRADLRGMRVEDFSANLGALSGTICLPASGSAEINAGASSIEVRVPRSSSVTLTTRGFPIAVSVPSSFESKQSGFGNGTWRQPGSGGDLRISVVAGAADIRVATY